MKNKTEFSQLVCDTRKKWGMSQDAFARELGTSVSCIHAWEQGLRNPPKIYQELLKKRFEQGRLSDSALTKRLQGQSANTQTINS